MSGSDLQDLAARLARGEEAAFAELYDACAARLHGYLRSRLGSSDTASDVVQSSFLRLVKSRRQLRRVENPSAYLFQIARNEANRLATKPRKTELPLAAAENYAESATDVCGDEREVIAKALSRLNSDEREIIELKLNGGLTLREIAEVVGMPQGTVATKYRRALEKVRPWLEKQLQ